MKFYRQSTVSKKTLMDILSKNTDYSEDEKKKIIKEIFEIDPDKKNHKNSAWLAKQYRITNGRLPENLTELLRTFNTLCDNKRIKDKELINYSIEDLRDVVTKGAEKGISRRDELEKRSVEGLREIDRIGEFVLYYATDYEVWKDRINTKMNEEGYECGWCIKDIENWNKISKDDYLYVEKNGKPWLVADNNSKQCRDYQDDANFENIKQCAYLLFKNGLKFSDDFKKEYLFYDENTPKKIKFELWGKVIKDSYDAYYLLWHKIITKEDKEIFNRAVEKAIENLEFAYFLLNKKIIKKEDGEIFNKVIEKILGKTLEKALENPHDAYALLSKKIITKEDGEIYKEAVEKALEDLGYAYYLFVNKIITKEDGEIYKKALEKTIENSLIAFELLRNEIIKKEDGEIYNKVVEKAIEISSHAYWLLRNKLIKKSEVSSELWEKLLASAEKHNPDARQKFAGRNYFLGKFYKISGIRIFYER